MGQSRTWPASRTTLLLISVPFFFFLSFCLCYFKYFTPSFSCMAHEPFYPFLSCDARKNPFVFWLPAVQENKLSVTKAKRAVVNNHCLLCLSPLYRFAFFILLILFFILSSSSVSCCLCQYKYFSPSKLLSTSYLAHFD